MLYPGAVETLDALAADGWRLGLCTNKPAHLAEDLMRRLGVRDRFHALLGADTLPVRKPDPDHVWQTIDRAGGARARAVMIGDTVTDTGAAAAAGIPCVLMDFGLASDGARSAASVVATGYDGFVPILARLVP